jgi:hypothetical protein
MARTLTDAEVCAEYRRYREARAESGAEYSPRILFFDAYCIEERTLDNAAFLAGLTIEEARRAWEWLRGETAVRLGRGQGS